MRVEHAIRLSPLDYKKAVDTSICQGRSRIRCDASLTDVVPTAKRAPKRTKPEAADVAATSTKYNLTFRKEKVPIFT